MEDCIGKFLFTNSTPTSSTELIKELSRSIMDINESFMASKIPIIAKIADICSDMEDVEDTEEPEEDRGQVSLHVALTFTSCQRRLALHRA